MRHLRSNNQVYESTFTKHNKNLEDDDEYIIDKYSYAPYLLKYGVMLLIFILLSQILKGQDRTGSIDLTASEGRHILLNDGSSGSELGIEGGSFTVEGWVYMVSNGNNDFNFFRLISGNRIVCLSYRGDGTKNTDEAWYIETKGLPEKGGKGKTWNWWFGYRSGFSAPTFLNQWHHVAFTCNNSSSIKLYIDGQYAHGYTMTHNGSALASLFPSDGDGKCEIGGGSINKGKTGKFFASEIRVWDAELTSTEIAKYYDEEVNASHPHWNDLVRYYHGNKSSGTGSDKKFEDYSPKNEYDAKVSHSDVGVSSNYTPNIKPADFNNNYYDVAISAQTCQSNSITVSWDDFENSGWDGHGSNYSYETGNGVHYELARSNGDVIYTGTGNSKTDSEIADGDTERYRLRTYFTINGNKVYSADEMYSNYGSMKSVFGAVNTFEASDDNCNGSIDLTWSWSGDNPPEWTIQRATNSGFSGATTLSSSIGASKRSYTDNSANIETTYYYRIKASGKDDNNCTVTSSWSSNDTGFTSQPPSSPSNLVVSSGNNALNISWTNSNGNNADGYVLKRLKVADNSETTINISDPATSSYTDSNIEECETYRYTIGAINECTGNNDPVYSNTTQTGLLGVDLSNVITSLDASKGYFGNTVRLEWVVNGGLSLIDRFRIERTIAGQDNYQLLKIVDNDLVFDDDSALPGQFYNYRVFGESVCGSNTVQTNEKVDLGFRQPFGIANGHIEYEGGNAVENVSVNFEKNDGSLIGKSLRFDGVIDYVNTGEYVFNSADEFTLEAWIKTSSTDSYIPLFGKDDNDSRWEKGERVIYLNSGKVTLEGHSSNYLRGSTAINDGQWHHIAIVFQKSSLTRKIYVDGKDDTNSSTNYNGSSEDKSNFKLRLGRTARGSHKYYEGLMDEIRIWDHVRTEEEIVLNYNRFISAEQSGLKLYFRCDEGVGTKVYDASNIDEVYNKNDGTFVNSTSFSDDVASAAQLGIRGVTDENGDYVADYIPYSGAGDIFRAVPALGQHAFEPSSRSIFFAKKY
ncbi:MAG: LamG-like jellyroll fold domain-containing protein, partial [Bacteroidota bacterium]